jgi:hypothetical protein
MLAACFDRWCVGQWATPTFEGFFMLKDPNNEFLLMDCEGLPVGASPLLTPGDPAFNSWAMAERQTSAIRPHRLVRSGERIEDIRSGGVCGPRLAHFCGLSGCTATAVVAVMGFGALPRHMIAGERIVGWLPKTRRWR